MILTDITLTNFGIVVSLLHGFSVLNKLAIGFIMFFQNKNKLFFRLMGLIIICPVPLFLGNLSNFLDIGTPLWASVLFVFTNTFMFWAAFYVLHPIFQIKFAWASPTVRWASVAPFGIVAVYAVWLWATLQPADYVLFKQQTAQQIEGPYMQTLNGIIYFNVMFYSAFMVYFMVRISKPKIKQLVGETATFNIKLQFARRFVYALFISSYGVVFTLLVSSISIREYIIIPIISNLLVFYLVYLIVGGNFVRFKFSRQYYYTKFWKFNLKPTAQKEQGQQALDALAADITNHFAQNKPYLDADFSLNQLASQINTPAYLVTDAIKTSLKTSFLAMVNQHRVAEVKKMLNTDAGQKMSVAGVGEQCGFRSKSALYRHFKEQTGQTPAQYLKQQNGH